MAAAFALTDVVTRARAAELIGVSRFALERAASDAVYRARMGAMLPSPVGKIGRHIVYLMSDVQRAAELRAAASNYRIAKPRRVF